MMKLTARRNGKREIVDPDTIKKLVPKLQEVEERLSSGKKIAKGAKAKQRAAEGTHLTFSEVALLESSLIAEARKAITVLEDYFLGCPVFDTDFD